jgi:hypothetical protein
LPSEAQTKIKPSAPAWQAHKKSVSEDLTTIEARRRARVSGIEQAVPVLLRQGFDVPASAYVELAQIKIHSSTPPDSPRAQHCQKAIRTNSQHSAPLLASYMRHRRAFSLDRSADDIQLAFDRYSRAKQEAHLAFE